MFGSLQPKAAEVRRKISFFFFFFFAQLFSFPLLFSVYPSNDMDPYVVLKAHLTRFKTF